VKGYIRREGKGEERGWRGRVKGLNKGKKGENEKWKEKSRKRRKREERIDD